MSEKPTSAADPRPNGEPYYIDTECPVCGEELVLLHRVSDEKRRQSDALADPETDPEDVEPFHDEWVCPECLDEIRMDWPEEYKESMLAKWQQAIEDVEEGKHDP